MEGIITQLSFTLIDHNNKERSFNCKIDSASTERQLEMTGEALGYPVSHMILEIAEKSWNELKDKLSVKLLEVFNKDC